MEVVSVSYAKAHFSALLGRVEQGEEFAITKRGKVVAKLVPVRTAAPSAARSQDVLYGDDGLPA